MAEETEGNRIRVLVIDDHALFRASLAYFLASQPDLAVAAECGTTDEALKALKGSIPVEVVLLNFDLGAESGSAFITSAREGGYQGHFLIVAGAADPRAVAVALKLGASGIFLKSEAPDRLVKAIRMVAGGESWIELKVVQMLANQLVNQNPQFGDTGSAPVLEGRERNVLLGILGGLTNKKIGENMGISESAIKNTVQRLFGRTGVKKRSQLVRVALEGSVGAARQLIDRQTSFEAHPKLGGTRNLSQASLPMVELRR